jgi:quercetin dioxygenase-like cupin family protein
MPAATIHRWSNLPADHPMPLIERRRIIGEKMMISQVHLSRGFLVPTHQHENEQFAVVVSGRIRFGLGAESAPEHRFVTLTGGEVIHLPANLPHSAEALEDTVILDLFSPPSAATGVDAHTVARAARP